MIPRFFSDRLRVVAPRAAVFILVSDLGEAALDPAMSRSQVRCCSLSAHVLPTLDSLFRLISQATEAVVGFSFFFSDFQ